MTHTRMSVPGDARPHDGMFTIPPIGGEPRLYALLAVETEPGRIVYFHVELDHTPGACTIDLEQDTENIHPPEYLAPLASHPSGPMRLTATLTGTIVSRDAAYQRPARAPAAIAENALKGVTRRLPLTDGGDR